MKYNFKDIEKKWQKEFLHRKPFAFKKEWNKKKYYCLEMYPYPSGNLHMGHIRNYSIGDVLGRFKRLQGFNVLHPIGWDAFGLPAENAAIQNKIHPTKWTFSNIDNMRKQLQKFGFSYDYDNEVCTAQEDYYRWGQWFFLKMHEMNLVYRKKATVNWDPIDKTVLAKEQVHDGKAWRSGAVVEKKEIEQWYIKISHYSEELLNELDKMHGWPEKVKIMQRNWIGKSEGVMVNFKFQEQNFPIFTTRVDTLYAASFMAIAFDHQNLNQYLNPNIPELIKKVREFKKKCHSINQVSDYEKEGLFLGSYVKNPLNGEKIPLYVTNFVLAEYGTGAIMGCPAHDQRDFEFAKKYSLPIKVVVVPDSHNLNSSEITSPYFGNGVLINSGKHTGLNNQLAKKIIAQYLEKNNLGKRATNYKLKDWLISRQRYWGNPIPMLQDKEGGYYPEEYDNLPVKLPTDVEFTGSGNPLETSKSFLEVTINQSEGNQKKLFRETDTMDTFTCSSWYFLRYVDSQNQEKPFEKKIADHYLPVDHYIGGVEHACMHLLYARFVHKVIRDMGLISSNEPFTNLTTQGMVIAPSYFSSAKGKYFHFHELNGNKKLCPETQTPLVVKKEKMSKSKKNGVDPEKMLEKYGADSLRLFILFAAPVEKDLEWNEKGIEGCSRFILKIINWFNKIKTFREIDRNSNEEKKIKQLSIFINQTIAKVTQDVEKLHFNTAIAQLMIFINRVSKLEFTTFTGIKKVQTTLIQFLTLLSPFAPFITEEIFSTFNQQEFLAHQNWPNIEKKWLKKEKVELIIQINGKLRSKLKVKTNLEREKTINLVKKDKKTMSYLKNKKIIKEIYIPNKLVNLVIQ